MPARDRVARLRDLLRPARPAPQAVPEPPDLKERMPLADRITATRPTPQPAALDPRAPAGASKPPGQASSPAHPVDLDSLPTTQPIPVRRSRTSPTPTPAPRTRQESATAEAHARHEAELREKPGAPVSTGPFVAEVPPPFVPTAAPRRPVGRFRPHYLRPVAAVLVVALLVVACVLVLARLQDGDGAVGTPVPATSASTSSSP